MTDGKIMFPLRKRNDVISEMADHTGEESAASATSIGLYSFINVNILTYDSF